MAHAYLRYSGVKKSCSKLCNVGKRFMLNDTALVNLEHVKLWYLRTGGQ